MFLGPLLYGVTLMTPSTFIYFFNQRGIDFLVECLLALYPTPSPCSVETVGSTERPLIEELQRGDQLTRSNILSRFDPHMDLLRAHAI